MSLDHRHALPSGYRLEKYEIETVLGIGTFGITYRALDTQLRQPVVIKEYLPSDLAVRKIEVEKDSTAYPNSSDAMRNYRCGSNWFIKETQKLAEKALDLKVFGVSYWARNAQLNQPVPITEHLQSDLTACETEREVDPTVHSKSSAVMSDYQWGLDCFIREAQTLARLNHPNIVQIHQVLQCNGTAYWVMSYEEGTTLADMLEEYGIPDEVDLRGIVSPLLNGLEAAHTAGCLHCHIKPANIYLRHADKSLVLLNFGTAKQALIQKNRNCSRSMLIDGYIPPEQYDSQSDLGPWTDIYALSATLYKVVTGIDPVESTVRVYAAYRRKLDPLEPAERLAQGRYSNELLRAIDRGLAIDETLRPQNVASWRDLWENGTNQHDDRPFSFALLGMASDVLTPGRIWVLLALLLLGVTSTWVYIRYDDYQVKQERLVQEQVFWEGIQNSEKLEELEAYQKQYPEGRFLALAQMRLDRLAQLRLERERLVQEQKRRDVLTQELKLVEIPGGDAWLGSAPDEEVAGDNEKPPRQVHVAVFHMGKYEVTRAQFGEFVADSGYKTESGCYQWTSTGWAKNPELNWRNPGFKQEENHPVTCVSWRDIQVYIAWLNGITGQRYRLPTEAEWEYAARGGTTSKRYWGDNADQACDYANVADKAFDSKFGIMGWAGRFNCKDNHVYTAAVGNFQPNRFGLYDMLGNVWEWTCSLYKEKYDGSEQHCIGNKDAVSLRVVRGGSWRSGPAYIRATIRNKDHPTDRSNFLGFRLAQD